MGQTLQKKILYVGFMANLNLKPNVHGITTLFLRVKKVFIQLIIFAEMEPSQEVKSPQANR